MSLVERSSAAVVAAMLAEALLNILIKLVLALNIGKRERRVMVRKQVAQRWMCPYLY